MSKVSSKRAEAKTKRPRGVDGKRLLHRPSRKDKKAKLRKHQGLKRRYPPGRHPNQMKHWWKPGKSGHPEGRPKKEHSITSLMKAYAEEVYDEDTGMTIEAAIAKAVVTGALRLDKTALKEFLGRVDGPIRQQIELEGKQSVDVSIGELTRELARRQLAKKRKKKKRRK